MKIRFALPVHQEERDDGLRLRHGPGRRPRLAHWRWYMALAIVALPAGWMLWGTLRSVACS